MIYGDNKNAGVVYKMMLNNKPNVDDTTQLFNPITSKLYNTNSDDMILFTRNLLMKTEPWIPGWEKKLQTLYGSFDNAVNELYSIVIGFN